MSPWQYAKGWKPHQFTLKGNENFFFHGRKLGRHLLCVTIGLFNIPQVTVSEEKFLVTYYDDNNIITCCVCLGGILEESKKKRKKKKVF